MSLLNKTLFSFLVFSFFSLHAGEPKFDWSTVLAIPPGSEYTAGNQILHFKSQNKIYLDNAQAKIFAQEHLQNATQLHSDAEVLRFGSDSVTLKGLFIELGVCTGKTINFIAALNPHQKIYGFDSFEGLPEDWIRTDKVIAAGTFGFKNPNLLPPVLHNVELIKGLFKDTLRFFIDMQEGEQAIAFLHVDCDIYSSTATAFEILGDRIKPGTIIVFDELFNYPGSENHEYKALQEFLIKHRYDVRYLAFNVFHEQVAVQIIQSEQY